MRGLAHRRLVAWFLPLACAAIWFAPAWTAPLGTARARVRITVSAAASLKDALTAIGAGFERAQPGIAASFNFGGSGTLELQIEQGAPADVFISASPVQMDALAAKNMLAPGARVDLLRNELVLIVPRDSNAVTGFRDLASARVKLVALGDPRSVPAGQYARQVLSALGIYDAVEHKAVIGTDVRQVLADVETGSADAGLVYATDAAISPRVRVVAQAPPGTHDPIVYPAAVLRQSSQPAAARAFLDYLRTSAAGAVFVRYGFQPAGK